MFSGRSVLTLSLFLACLMIPAASFADSGVDFSNTGGTLSGSTQGQFYGPNAQELGGAFILTSGQGVETFAGAYGAKR